MTHINAYYADVSEAEQKVVEANGELENAKRRLREKEIEQGLPVTYPETSEKAEDESVESEKSDDTSPSEPVKKGGKK